MFRSPFSSTTSDARCVVRSGLTVSREIPGPDAWWNRLDRGLVRIGVGLILGYRTLFGSLTAGACRFEPSCSHYAEAALRQHGSLRGSWLTLRRLSRCHPFHAGGYDPVPHDDPAAHRVSH